MKNNSLSLKVFFGYFVAVSMLAIVVVFTLVSTAEVKVSSNNISQYDVPALATSLTLLSEVNRSLSSLKGWVSIGENRQRDERVEAWKNIDSSFYTLRDMAREQGNKNLESDLSRIRASLDKLRGHQQKIEAIAHTLENNPGLKILVEDASPQAKLIINSIDQMAEVENQRPLSFERREMLRRMNGLRHSMSTCMFSIREYLISSNEKHLKEFEENWINNGVDFDYIQSHRSLLTDQQKDTFDVLAQARKQFILYPDQMFHYRQGPEWDTAKLLMDKWVGPLEIKIKTDIDNIIQTHNNGMNKEFASISRDFDFLLSIGATLLVLSILICSFLARFVSRLVVGPIEQVVNTANSISQGDFDVDMDIKGSYEAESLRDSLLNMMHFLKRVAGHASLVAEGNLDAEFSPRGDKDTLGLALQKMTINLKQARTESDSQNWVKTGQARLSEEIRGLLQVTDIASVALKFISQYMQSNSGALYLFEGSVLKRTASHIQFDRTGVDQQYELGEGIVGKTAQDQVIMIHKPLPDQSFMNCDFGLGESTPTSIVSVPLLSDRDGKQSTLGVIVFGTDIHVDDNAIELFEKFSDCLSSAIEMANSRSSLQQLLEESQQQSEELQSQQEELRAANEELEQKAYALQSSEEEMKAQSEELINSNYILEQQKAAVEHKSKELEQTSKYKSEFMANMSHELRTPLNSLLILSESLEKNHDKNLTEEQVEDARVIFEAGSSLLSLINDILDLSKVEAGKLKLQSDDVNIKTLALAIESQFKPIAEASGLRFTIDVLCDESTYLYTDRMRLEQILRNLLSNAFKFTSQGGVTLSIDKLGEASPVSEQGKFDSGCISFCVKDTGIGIKKELQHKIFEAFQQADGSTCRVYGGSGLGLTISKEMAHMLNGELSLSSEEGVGSEFTLHLPVVDRDAIYESKSSLLGGELINDPRGPAAMQDHYREAPGLIPASLSSNEKTILIVEDDIGFLKKLVEVSIAKGFKCFQACSGQEALSLVAELSPSAIILDIGLPDMSGMEVLDRLKANISTRDIPVHIISAQDDDDVALKKGAIGFITKPILLEDVDCVLNKFEVLIQKNIKKILLMDSSEGLGGEVDLILKNRSIDIHSVENNDQAMYEIHENSYDCCILNLSRREDMSYWTVNHIVGDDNIQLPPIIVYTNQTLSESEYENLLGLTNRIIIKGNRSTDRLKDELECFLYSIKGDESLNTTPVKSVSSSDLEGRKILLVDDDLRNTYALSKELRRYGAQVYLADNGDLAIKKISKESSMDLVLMDVMMPIMDGYETMKTIRSRYSTTIPIIAITAKAMTDDKRKCLEAGANDYMPKPVKVDQLVSMIKMWVS